MKNLMKAPIRRTTESWPTNSPCVNERLAMTISFQLLEIQIGDTYEDCAG